jgi:hypothetical protein
MPLMVMADLNAVININGRHKLTSLMDAINGDHQWRPLIDTIRGPHQWTPLMRTLSCNKIYLLYRRIHYFNA